MKTQKNWLTFAFGCLFLFYQSAQAQGSDAGSALNKIIYSINALVWTAANYIFQAPPNIGTEIVTNYAQTSALNTVPPNIKSLNDKDIVLGLTPDTSTPNATTIQLAAITASDTIVPGLTMGGVPVPFYSQDAEKNSKNKLLQGNENFNFQSLIVPNLYETPEQQNNALNYIRFVSGYGTPLSSINLGSYPESQLSTAQKITIQTSGAYQAFLVQRRQLVAQQSAMLTNLYAIYARRLPIQSLNPGDVALGTLQPNTTTNVNNQNANKHPSAEQIQAFTATWRTANQALAPQWFTQMGVASPANVQREQLFVLAEIEALLYRLHQDNERMIALLAINQVANFQTSKQTLQLTEKNIQQLIDNEVKGNAQKGTTSPTTQNAAVQNNRQQAKGAQLKSAEQSIKQQAKQTAKQQANINPQ